MGGWSSLWQLKLSSLLVPERKTPVSVFPPFHLPRTRKAICIIFAENEKIHNLKNLNDLLQETIWGANKEAEDFCTESIEKLTIFWKKKLQIFEIVLDVSKQKSCSCSKEEKSGESIKFRNLGKTNMMMKSAALMIVLTKLENQDMYLCVESA